MGEWHLRTAVAFIIYRRPQTTARVFEAIRQARPPVLLVIADGPKAGRPEEAELCRATRAVVEEVDWPCQVLREYADSNLGCRARVSSGLDWVFRTVEEAIILEDDCLPHLSFFRFCEELLEHYRCDERVMHIAGSNFLCGRSCGEASYYFSRYPHVWGWASWRRAWAHYDATFAKWCVSVDKAEYLKRFESRNERRFWRSVWDGVAAGRIDSWAYQWAFACITQGGLSVVPSANLVSNIGMGVDATHTLDRHHPFADLPTFPLAFPLRHPSMVARDRAADEWVRRRSFSARSPLLTPLKPLYRLLRRIWHAWR